MQKRETGAEIRSKTHVACQAARQPEDKIEASFDHFTHRDPLDQVVCRFGDGACAKAHAASLEPTATAHPSRSPSSLLRLQRTYGNRYTGQVLRRIQEPGLGVIQRRVRESYVSCRASPPTAPIFTVMGTADPIGVITPADTQAIAWLDTVIGELEYTQTQIRGGALAAAPTINDTLAESLRNRFGIDLENGEVWTSTRHRTAGGSGTIALLLTRLRAVRRILDGGWIRYTCIGGDCETGDWAYTYEGEYRIYLCQPFWRGGANDQALTVLHEAFHIYYGATDTGRHMWNAHCIEQFVADFNGVTIPADFAASCS